MDIDILGQNKLKVEKIKDLLLDIRNGKTIVENLL